MQFFLQINKAKLLIVLGASFNLSFLFLCFLLPFELFFFAVLLFSLVFLGMLSISMDKNLGMPKGQLNPADLFHLVA